MQPDSPQQSDDTRAMGTSAHELTASRQSPTERPKPATQLTAILAGLFGAVVVWGILQAFYPFHVVTDAPKGTPTGAPPYEEVWRVGLLIKASDRINAAAVFGLFGATVSGSLAVANGIWRLPAVSALLRFLIAIAVGALGGLAVATFFQPLSAWLAEGDRLERGMRTVVSQVAIWTCLGIAIGVGNAIIARGSLSIPRFVAGAALGGLLAGMIYAPAVSILLPLASTEQHIPHTAGMRFVWLLLPATLICLLSTLALRRRPSRAPSPQ